MRTKERIIGSEELIQWLGKHIDGLKIGSEARTRIAAGCLYTALEHHKAIVLLVSRSLFGPAFALVRLLFEAYIRGKWLYRCASDSDLELFKAGKLNKNFDTLVEEIDKIEGSEEDVQSDAEFKSYRAMDSYTHSRFQIFSRNTACTIEPKYSDDEIVEALNFANVIGLFSALEISHWAGSKELVESFLEKLEKSA